MAAKARISAILDRQFYGAVAARLDVATATALAETLDAATTAACDELKKVRPDGGWRGVTFFGMDVEDYDWKWERPE